MAYFNGTMHGFNSSLGYVPPKPMTKLYCDDCAETCIPLPPKTGDEDKDGQRHWKTEFRWANWSFEKPCDHCKKPL